MDTRILILDPSLQLEPWGTPPPANEAFDYTTTSNGFYNNILDEPRSGYRGRSAFAEVAHTTDATSVAVTINTFRGDAFEGTSVGVWINDTTGAPYAILPTIGGQMVTVATTNLPAGTKKVIFRQGTVQNATGYGAGNNNRQGYDIMRIEYSGATTATQYVPTRLSKRVVHLTDSIGVGAGTTVYVRDGYIPLLRASMTDWEHISLGSAGTDPNFFQSADLDKVVAALSGAAQKVVWWEQGTNLDTGLSAQQVADIIGPKLDYINQQDSAIRIIGQVIFYRQNNTAYDNIRAGMRLVASSRAWVELVETSDWVGETDLADIVHFNDTGNGKIAARIKDVLLNGTTSPVDPNAPYTDSQFQEKESYVTLANKLYRDTRTSGTLYAPAARNTTLGVEMSQEGGMKVTVTEDTTYQIFGWSESIDYRPEFKLQYGLYVLAATNGGGGFKLAKVFGDVVASDGNGNIVAFADNIPYGTEIAFDPTPVNFNIRKRVPGGSWEFISNHTDRAGKVYPQLKLAIDPNSGMRNLMMHGLT